MRNMREWSKDSGKKGRKKRRRNNRERKFFVITGKNCYKEGK